MNQWKVWSRDLYEWASLNYVTKVFAYDLHWRPADKTTEAHFCHCNHILDAYRFRIGIQDFETANKQRDTAQIIRSIADKPEYADLKTVFMHLCFVPNETNLTLFSLLSQFYESKTTKLDFSTLFQKNA